MYHMNIVPNVARRRFYMTVADVSLDYEVLDMSVGEKMVMVI